MPTAFKYGILQGIMPPAHDCRLFLAARFHAGRLVGKRACRVKAELVGVRGNLTPGYRPPYSRSR